MIWVLVARLFHVNRRCLNEALGITFQNWPFAEVGFLLHHLTPDDWGSVSPRLVYILGVNDETVKHLLSGNRKAAADIGKHGLAGRVSLFPGAVQGGAIKIAQADVAAGARVFVTGKLIDVVLIPNRVEPVTVGLRIVVLPTLSHLISSPDANGLKSHQGFERTRRILPIMRVKLPQLYNTYIVLSICNRLV